MQSKPSASLIRHPVPAITLEHQPVPFRDLGQDRRELDPCERPSAPAAVLPPRLRVDDHPGRRVSRQPSLLEQFAEHRPERRQILADTRRRQALILHGPDQLVDVPALDLVDALPAEGRDDVLLKRALIARSCVLIEPAPGAALVVLDPLERVGVEPFLDLGGGGDRSRLLGPLLDRIRLLVVEALVLLAAVLPDRHVLPAPDIDPVLVGRDQARPVLVAAGGSMPFAIGLPRGGRPCASPRNSISLTPVRTYVRDERRQSLCAVSTRARHRQRDAGTRGSSRAPEDRPR